MTAQELMQPRFEVLAEYPNSKFKKGDILERISDIEEIEKYPHLFRKLNWWEFRKIEDMPKKLMLAHIPDSVYIISLWDMTHLFGITNEKTMEGCYLKTWRPEIGYFPID